MSFDEGARWGYLATSFAALRAGGAGAGTWLAINGVTGTLGVGAVMLALAMGVTRILGWGRNRAVLQELEQLAPRRIATMALGDKPIASWVHARTEGVGGDLLIDCTGRGGPAAPRGRGAGRGEARRYHGQYRRAGRARCPSTRRNT